MWPLAEEERRSADAKRRAAVFPALVIHSNEELAYGAGSCAPPQLVRIFTLALDVRGRAAASITFLLGPEPPNPSFTSARDVVAERTGKNIRQAR